MRKMEAKILTIDGKEKGKIELPEQFKEPVREDIIKRVVLAIQSHKRQKYGSDPRAGLKQSAKLSKRRRAYRGSYGFGISRTPRKILTRRGTRFGWVGAVSPNTVGGRRAHPPKAEKNWREEVNDKERKKAIRSAIAASNILELVKKRHKIGNIEIPIILENKFESLNKTKEVKEVLNKIGLEKELERAKEKKIRSGRGKMRNRPYKRKVGPLVSIGQDKGISKSCRNIAGIDVVNVKDLNVSLLAPGTQPGRLIIWTENAIKELKDKNLFM